MKNGKLSAYGRVQDLKNVEKASYFSVVYSASRFPTEGEAQLELIPFDKVLSQFPKNVYDTSRGVFICPKNGAYMFNFSMRPDAPPIQSFSVQLMKEEEAQVSLYANPTPDGHAGQSSQSCILNVRQGEKVWLRLVHGAIRSDMRAPSATFSGTLLRHIKNME
ncbi:complement C1q tumor necrosis factor-related protein 4-like [Amphiura filiformis]|uniref:complement C1q tumor necrosis factor-related protein 4-like n=1 Tax=Amphiura filiformis TaxID=82378 RepID=UPI003B212EF8